MVLVCLVLAAFAVTRLLERVTHQIPTGSGGGLWVWGLLPYGVVGFVVAWRKPRNPLGWIFVGLVVALALSAIGGAGDLGNSPVSIAEIPHLIERSASRLC